jgi:hypothetical protein
MRKLLHPTVGVVAAVGCVGFDHQLVSDETRQGGNLLSKKR